MSACECGKLASRPQASKPHFKASSPSKASAKSLILPKRRTHREQTAPTTKEVHNNRRRASPIIVPKKSRRGVTKESPSTTKRVQTTPLKPTATPKRAKLSPKVAESLPSTPRRSPKPQLRLHRQDRARSAGEVTHKTSKLQTRRLASKTLPSALLEQTDSSPGHQSVKNHYLTKTVKLRMAAQSGKLFQDILCESRAHPVETTDPIAAKTIDELKKHVSRQKADIETERAKLRELQRSHEKEIKSLRDEAEKKLEKSLEALSRRKDDEKLTEISQVKERLLKQNQQELRTQRGDLEDEMRRLERRLTKEREDSMRKILNLERKRTEEELSHYVPEDAVMTREEHLKAEIFRLGEEVERLEFQVRGLVDVYKSMYLYMYVFTFMSITCTHTIVQCMHTYSIHVHVVLTLEGFCCVILHERLMASNSCIEPRTDPCIVYTTCTVYT